MLKSELLKSLEIFGDDDVIVIGDAEHGWCNIECLEKQGGIVHIMPDYTMPFTDDK